jgi:hypothetical protein
MGGRTWVKIFTDKWFEGTIRQESALVRGVFVDLLALAGKLGDDGKIRLPGTTIGYTDLQVAAILNIGVPEWVQSKDRLSNHPIEKENRITVTPDNVIEIINWGTYQSEYSRQKGYRYKLQPKVTSKGDQENRRRIEGEVDLDQKKDQTHVPRPKSNGRFTPPTIEQVTEYCNSRNNSVDPVKWYAHYTSNGWRVGKNPMKSWKAAVVTWERN